MTIDSFGCLNNTIKVAAGHYIDLANPNPCDIDIFTISAALSKMCRFGCHCLNFYSVAEHLIHATNLAIKDGIQGEALKAVFLHDAPEAYIGDVVKPLKMMLPDYMRIEGKMEIAVEVRFGVKISDHQEVVKKYDRLMLKVEKLALFPGDKEQWEGLGGIQTANVEICCWEPARAEARYFAMSEKLGIES